MQENLPRPQLYHMSEEELAAVKSTIADYLQKGWIHPSASLYGVTSNSNT